MGGGGGGGGGSGCVGGGCMEGVPPYVAQFY